MILMIASRTKTKHVQRLRGASRGLLALTLAWCVACEEGPSRQGAATGAAPHADASASSRQVPSTTPEDTPRAPIALSPLTVKAQAMAPQVEGVSWEPKREEVEQALRATLAKRGEEHGVLLDADRATTTYPAALTYAAIEMPTAQPNSPRSYLIAASIDLQGRPEGWHSSRIERVQVIEELPPDEAARGALVMRLIDEVSSALLLRHAIAMTPDASLLDAIEARVSKEPPLPVEVAIDATQRLRSARRSPGASVDPARASALLRAFATREEPTLTPIVFTALQEYDALDGLGPLMVEAATLASKNNQLPVYLSLLSQMGSVSDDATRAYLESVATGHPEESIRQIARESLERQRSKTRPGTSLRP